MVDLLALEETFSRSPVRAYLLCHPQNPVGTVHSVADLSALAQIAMRNGVTVISDEIHGLLDLGRPFVPFLMCGMAARAVGVTVTAASKAWNLTGANCAIAVWHNPEFDRIAGGVATGLRWSTGTLGAIAAQAAFAEGTEWLDAFCVVLKSHAEMIQHATDVSNNRIRWDGVDAGYLAWLDLSEMSIEPAAPLLREAGIATIDGHHFGPGGIGHCRLNFACSTETLQAALTRILRWCHTIAP